MRNPLQRNCLTVLIILTLLGCIPCPAAAVMYFSGEFTRDSGRPVVDARSFPATGGPATLKVFNGGPEGFRPVSSTTVKVNGLLVFGPSDFNQNIKYLEAPLTLKPGTNVLEVQLMGKPGEIIRVEIGEAAADYTGTYCFTLAEPNSIMATEVSLEQTGNTALCTLADLANLAVNGSINGKTLTIGEAIPNLGDLNLTITFSDDGQPLSGTFSIGPEQGTVTGRKGPCANYAYPAGDPVCNLPVAEVSLVVGGQQYNGTTHTGLDFEFATPDPPVLAPCDGVVKGINRHAISGGNIIIDLDIRYNQNWGTFIAFEPYSPDELTADLQESKISALLNQVVKRGDLLGSLVVPPTEYPHIHWQVYRNDAGRTPVCPRTYLTPTDQSALDALYGSLLGPSNNPLLPVCLAP